MHMRCRATRPTPIQTCTASSVKLRNIVAFANHFSVDVSQPEKSLPKVVRAVVQDEAFHPGSFSIAVQGCALRRIRLRKVCGICSDHILLDRSLVDKQL